MSTSESAAPEPSAPRCPRCQAVLPADAPAGLCPACLVSEHFGADAATEPSAAAQAPAVDEIAPHFPQLEILACLGRGGMGVVYRARQKSLGRLVALKLLAPERGADPAFAERFAREAQALARLDHPHIVTIHDFGRAGGYYYLLMEYVDGVTLRQLVHGGRIAAREALAIVPQICDALQFAHDHGVVHRDIKPENILLDRRGQVKVADFGLAKLVGPGGEPAAASGDAVVGASADITVAGHVMGTPRYMAPEQRERPTEVDHRADIYALGVVLYQMLTGELPGEKQLDPPSRRVRVDVRLDEIVLRALEKDPERRYASATEFKTRIETFSAEPPPAGVGADESLFPSPPPPARPPAAVSPEEARRAAIEKLKPAATALIVTSALDLAGLLIGLLVGAGLLFFLPMLGIGAGMAASSSSTFKFFGTPLHIAGAMAGVAMAVVVLWLGLNVAANLFVISAARRMMKGRDPGRAKTGAIIAIVLGALGLLTMPSHPENWLIGLWAVLQIAAGIWAFVLLRQPELAVAFEDASGAAPAGAPPVAPAPDGVGRPSAASSDPVENAASRRVSAPAAGLMIAAGVQLLLLGLVFAVIAVRFIFMPGHARMILPLVGPALILLVGGLSGFVFFGAARMRRLRGHGLAICAAVVAIVTFQGLFLGPIFGVWALVVLLRREVREAFDAAPGVAAGASGEPSPSASAPLAAESPENVARRVAAPSTGLMVAAGLQLLVVGAALVFYLFFAHYRVEGGAGTLELGSSGGFHYRSSTTPPMGPPKWYLFAPVALGLGLLFPAFTFFSALRMRRLRNHGLAVCGALLAILTLQGAGLGVIFGVWALAVLWRREVHRAFDESRPAGRGRGCLYAAGVLLLAAILAVAGTVGLFSLAKSMRRSAGVSSLPVVETPAVHEPIAPPAPVVLTASFGSVRTWTLPFAGNDETALLDLEAARLAGAPGAATAAFESRADVSGVYFKHNRATHELALSGLAVDVMGLDRFGDGIWDDFNHVELRTTIGQNLRNGSARISTVVNDPGGGSQPHTFLFKTRTGASGLLRVASLSRDPHEISIEWKFFSDAEPVAKTETVSVEAGPLTTERLEANDPALTAADAAALRALRDDLEKRLVADFEANQGAPGPDHAYLSLWIARIGAELARRPLASLATPSPTSPSVDGASVRRELEARLSAAGKISQWTTRDELLSVLAADAVKAGEVAVARKAISTISQWQPRDEAARAAALALKTAGRRDDAVAIAGTISQWQLRDQTMAEIGR